MWRTIAILLLSAPSSWAAEEVGRAFQVREQAFETSTAQIRIPDRAPATISIRTCSTCPAKQLQLAATSLYLIGREEATAQQFSRHLAQNGEIDLVIFFDSATAQITRLVAARGRSAAVR